MPTEADTEPFSVQTVADDDRATVHRLGRAHLASPKTVEAAVPEVATLRLAAVAVGEEYSRRFADLSATGRVNLARRLAAERLVGPFGAARAAILRSRERHAAVLTDTRGPIIPINRALERDPEAVRLERAVREAQRAAVASELRTYADTLKPEARFTAATAYPALRQAVVDGGLVRSGLPAEMYGELVRQAAIYNLTARSATEHLTAPTPDDPVGGQVDHEAARAEAEASYAAQEAKSETLDAAPQVLAQIVSIVAMLTDMHRDAALALLNGEGAA